MNSSTPRFIRYVRIARVGLHLLWGLATVAVVFPFIGLRLRRALRQRWSRQILEILAIHLRARGTQHLGAGLVVSNHISWLDIFVMNAIHPVAFVSKDEVLQWPIIGRLAAMNETIFLRRGSRGHAKTVGAEITSRLAEGHPVALFPEGTTTLGSDVLHFHAALLQPAVDAQQPLIPVSLHYADRHGRRSEAPAYAGETTMGECFWAIVSQPRLVVDAHILPPLPTQGQERKVLAREAREMILATVATGRPPMPEEEEDEAQHPSLVAQG